MSSNAVLAVAPRVAGSESPSRFDEQARGWLRDRGERVTQPRALVLATLLSATEADEGHPAYSHLELSERLGAALDRVTLYRVLEWLTAIGLVHKVTGDDRVGRFGLSDLEGGAPDPHGAGHAHFTCSTCHRVYCLDEAPHGSATRASLPAGFAAEEWTVTVRGVCRSCSSVATRASR
jgi:Fur family ferric uptake transcriptional regulator